MTTVHFHYYTLMQLLNICEMVFTKMFSEFPSLKIWIQFLCNS